MNYEFALLGTKIANLALKNKFLTNKKLLMRKIEIVCAINLPFCPTGGRRHRDVSVNP